MRRRLLPRLLLPVLLLLVTGHQSFAQSGDVLISTNTAWPEASYNLQSLRVTAGATLSIAGGATVNVVGSVTVAGGSAILLQGKNRDGLVNGSWLGAGVTISAGSVQVDAGSRISADGQGYTSPGQGGPGGSDSYTSGGAYGGRGSNNSAAPYGSYLAPTDLGSAGGGSVNGWSAGGGAIRLIVSGTLTNNGTISANGQTSVGGNTGGASGGSIYVTTATLAGSGTFTANGNAGSNANGGGGRVALHYVTNVGFDLDLVAASPGGAGASAGTVYLLANGADLHVTSNLVLPPDTSASHASVTVTNGALLTLGGGSSLVVTGTFRVTEASTIALQGKNNDGSVNGSWLGAGVTISAGSLQVDAGSRITADGQGYTSGQGPGGSVSYAGGGTYGGRGSNNSAAPYGSYLAPTDLGSAGGGSFNGWSAAGGAIRLIVTGTLTNNGTISANGQTSVSGNSGGASGGSIYVTTGTLAGSGTFAADGNAGGSANGGGGRVAIHYVANTGFDPDLVTANPGGAGATAGTVYLLANGADLYVTSSLLLPPDTGASYANVTVSNGALLTLGGGSSLVVSGMFRITEASTVLVQSKNNSGSVNGSWLGAGAAIDAGSMQIDAGSRITADGQGYTTGQGPGASANYWTGASHGGQGSGASPATYGLPLTPTDLGSGGGASYGGWSYGGGAIRLVVSGTLTHNGTISANGQSGSGNNAGASGGSIYVIAGTLAGSGAFAATGSAGTNASGGGGRIAIYHQGGALAPLSISVEGGAGAAAGTIAFQVNVATTPPGLGYSVDGQAYSSPQALRWLVGDTHVLNTTSTQAGAGGATYVFASWSDGGALSHAVTASLAPAAYTASFNGRYQLSVDHPLLRIGVVRGAVSGGAQEVTVSQSGTGPLTWTATSDRPWLQVSPASGSAPGRLSVQVDPAHAGLQALGTTSGQVTVSSPQALSPAVIEVVVTVSAPGSTAAPFGQIDTPTQNATSLVGAIGVTGWAMDDVGVSEVRIYRNCLAFENPINCQTVAGNRVVFIGTAAFLAGARPDVEAAFPGNPHAYRAGWGYLMLTNMLPHMGKGVEYGGQGLLTIYAVATDAEGQSTLLGRSRLDYTPTVITLANDTIGKPFGAIDTPGQGQTVSGWLANFGWALTPDSNTTAEPGDILIPTDGSTMHVFIDGAPVGQVAYNQCRGSAAVGNPVGAGLFCDDDVANIFGNPTPLPTFTVRVDNPTKHRNLDRGRAAIGSFVIDTRTLTNGLHTIAWGVIDSAGRTEGIGSRFFNVLNDGVCAACQGDAAPAADARPGRASAAALPDAAAASRGNAASLDALVPAGNEVPARTGFDPAAPFDLLPLDDDGVRRVHLQEFGRLELDLGPVDTAFLVTNGTLRDLPPGSRLDAGTGHFTWMPGVGYLGTYHLVFVRGAERTTVAVTIRPAAAPTPGQAEIRMSIDSPRAVTISSGTFSVAGWALDPRASVGSGIAVVHVWAQRRDVPAADPVFLGAADLGVARPDVARAFGPQFGRAGYTLATSGLAGGCYDITVYVWNRRTSRWEDARTVRVSVR